MAQDKERPVEKEGRKKSSIFREKSLERISSPEEIDDYMKVTSPGMWLVLGAVFFLLAAAFFWSVTGRIELVENGQVTEFAPITLLVE